MAKATSTSESSLSSILATALLGAVGVDQGISKSVVKPAVRKSFAKKFTDRIRQEAGTQDLWGDTASVLSVDIGDDDVVKVSASGTPEQMYDAELLEYGTPSSPPRAVMRTYEANFNEEYATEKSGFGL